MLSSLVIARLMDENRSQEDGPPLVLPLPRALARPASAHRRALAPFPDRLGIPAPSEDGGPRPPSPGGPRRGFASITVTARRVRPSASAPAAWGAGPDSLCPKCRCSPGLAGGSHPRQQRGPLTCAEIPPRHGPVGRQRSPQARTRPCGAPRERAVGAHGEDAGGGLGADSSPPGRDALVFSSCVHLRVSRPCPKAGCALGKALWVPVQPAAPAAGPQTHRSVLSLSLNCSSHRPTADGGDGTANAEPMGSLEPGLGRPPLALPGPAWGPAPPDSQPQEQPAVERVFLGTGPCPWSGSPPLGDREWTDAGTQQLAVKKRKEDPAASRTGCPGNQLSIHIPGWSFRAETKVFSGSSKAQQGQSHGTLSAPSVQQKPCKQSPPDGDSSPSEDGQSSDLAEPTERRRPRFLTPKVPWSGFLCPFQELYTSLQEDSVQIGRDFPKGDYTCCDLVVRIKDCEDPSTPKPSPAPPLPQTSDLLEDGSEPQQTTTGSMTLQEALEVHKPQFISRSQERLKKLEHMVQQRKAQQKEKLGQKQSPSPLRTSKKQFTIPHPLSDNLFKPKERCISEKEMHMRSRRIYNNLPEVKKKKEEQKKRVILQSNRLRAEVFKKQLLDQLLQRNAV